MSKSSEHQLQSALDATYRGNNPLGTLWRLFDTRRPQMLMGVVIYVIKQSPVWVLPIVTGNIITRITEIYAAHQAGHATSK